MSQKGNVYDVNSLLSNFDKTGNKEKTEKVTKTNTDDWGEYEEESNTTSFAGGTKQSSPGKPKAKPKKNQGGQDWTQLEQQPTPKPVEVEQPTGFVEKKKVMKKIGEPRPAEVNISEQAFPELGKEPPKSEKKEENKNEASLAQNNNNGGPKRFMNVKKGGQGETFSPMEAVQEKVPVIVTPVSQPQQEKSEKIEKPAEKIFSRATEAPVIISETAPQDDGKFKFGGVKKFTSTKVATKPKEEEKSEQDILREQKEREAEEKIMKEKEEFRKQLEAMDKKRDMNGGKKSDLKRHDNKPEDDADGFIEQKQHRSEKKEHHEHQKPHRDGDGKKHSDNKPKESNQKNGEKPIKKASEEIVKEAPPQVIEQDVKAVETKVVVTTAGTAGWDQMIRKPKKN